MSSTFNIDAKRYPFVIVATLRANGIEVWRKEVTGPGKIAIPPLAKLHGGEVDITLLWPDGTRSP